MTEDSAHMTGVVGIRQHSGLQFRVLLSDGSSRRAANRETIKQGYFWAWGVGQCHSPGWAGMTSMIAWLLQRALLRKTEHRQRWRCVYRRGTVLANCWDQPIRRKYAPCWIKLLNGLDVGNVPVILHRLRHRNWSPRLQDPRSQSDTQQGSKVGG